LENRQEEIHAKGFNMNDTYRDHVDPLDYGKIKVGTKTLDDAILNLGSIRKAHRTYGNKQVVLRALGERNLPLLREISNYFYSTNGIYSRMCNYTAFLYRYDWYIVPEILDDTVKEEKVLKEFNNLLSFLDNTHIKKQCGDIALEVIKNGAYYGYMVPSEDGIILQQLPINYCRSRYFVGDSPAVEFNMRFFDDNFRDINYRLKVLKMFPKEFQEGYLKYKQGKLPIDNMGDPFGTWFLLDPQSTVKFNFHNSDIPLFVNAIPEILDLDAAQELDRRKQMQQLLKVVIQKLPLDKNGDLVFDVDEARDIHNNAVDMLQHAIGVDVLTTFADITVEDMADSNTTTTTDDLEKMERAVYNAFGTSQNLFNTDGNLSLEKSILNDESNIRDLLLQFHIFYDRVVQSKCNNKRKYKFRFYMLDTTQYNYTDRAKMYKEQVQNGYSKMLPQIAMGHSQSSIIHTAYFENEILHLTEIMIPPLMSSTLNGEDILGKNDESKSSNNQSNSEGKSSQSSSNSDGTAGRPEKSDDEKSEKTIANKESMS
jgi:hypothetical protein